MYNNKLYMCTVCIQQRQINLIIVLRYLKNSNMMTVMRQPKIERQHPTYVITVKIMELSLSMWFCNTYTVILMYNVVRYVQDTLK